MVQKDNNDVVDLSHDVPDNVITETKTKSKTKQIIINNHNNVNANEIQTKNKGSFYLKMMKYSFYIVLFSNMVGGFVTGHVLIWPTGYTLLTLAKSAVLAALWPSIPILIICKPKHFFIVGGSVM